MLGFGLAIGEAENRPAVFVSNDDDTIDALELGRGRPLIRVPDATGSVNSMVFGRNEGHPVLAAGPEQGRVHRLVSR
nr:hypothetical protein GCM10025732_08640 [Glycomyces mayteni]